MTAHERSLRALVKGYARIGVEITPMLVHNVGAIIEHWPATSESADAAEESAGGRSQRWS